MQVATREKENPKLRV